jgi:hypothetical protein
MYTIDGVMQFAAPAKPVPGHRTDIHQGDLFGGETIGRTPKWRENLGNL